MCKRTCRVCYPQMPTLADLKEEYGARIQRELGRSPLYIEPVDPDDPPF